MPHGEGIPVEAGFALLALTSFCWLGVLTLYILSLKLPERRTDLRFWTRMAAMYGGFSLMFFLGTEVAQAVFTAVFVLFGG